MKKTKIEWCDSTWNPVTGCLHDCGYCYARNIAHRFSLASDFDDKQNHILDAPCFVDNSPGGDFDEPQYIKDPYPFGFSPTFHRYRLGEPAKMTKPRTIFVCSMADLFGNWVPDKWIEEVFKACEQAPQHRYLFLTKKGTKYDFLNYIPTNNNFWYGMTITGAISYQELDYLDSQIHGSIHNDVNTFISIEPLLEPMEREMLKNINKWRWVIIGAETGNRKEKIIPKKEWIDEIIKACYQADVPVFMKNSLIPIVGEENILREFPWERAEQ